MNKMCGACGLKMSYLRKTVAFSVKRKKITYKVAYMTTRSKILDAAEMLQHMLLLSRLKNIANASDAVANDVQYYRKNWAAAHLKENVEQSLPQQLEDVNLIVADIKMQDIV